MRFEEFLKGRRLRRIFAARGERNQEVTEFIGVAVESLYE